SAAAGKEIETLVEQCKRRKMPSVLLIDAYRTYLVNHLTAARCADSEMLQVKPAASGPADSQGGEAAPGDAANFFNQKLLAPPLQPLQESDVTPSRVEGRSAEPGGCEDAVCKALVERARAMGFNTAGLAYHTVE